MPTYTWTKLSPATQPGAREVYNGMAYDLARSKVIAVGGNFNGTSIESTYSWDGTTWTSIGTPFPFGSGFGKAAAWDAANGNVVTFGGSHLGGLDSCNNDTWIWDGSSWTQLHPTHAPNTRQNAVMFYCPALGQVVLFGGLNTSNLGLRGDTWAWDGTDWTQLAPAHTPSKRYGANMAAWGTGVLIFGGITVFPAGTVDNQTWIFDGTDWTQQAPTHAPAARAGHQIAYWPTSGLVHLQGGDDVTTTVFTDNWAWDGSDWTAITPTVNIGARYDAGMAYDPNTTDLLLFGGQTLLTNSYKNETWLFSGTGFGRPTARVTLI